MPRIGHPKPFVQPPGAKIIGAPKVYDTPPPESHPFQQLVENFLKCGERCVKNRVAPSELTDFDKLAILALSGVPLSIHLVDGECRVAYQGVWTIAQNERGTYDVIDETPKPEDERKAEPTKTKFTKRY